MNNRAYSLLDVKSLDDERRVITGMATTPAPDRVGDIVEPLGVTAAQTIPLFLYHDSTKTVGTVQLGRATKAGVPFTATLPKISEPGALRDRVEEAWQMVKHGLIAAVSIGFRAFEDGIETIKGGGLRFLKSEVLELSLVPVPANAQALIHTVKSADAGADRAAADLIARIKSLDTQNRAAPGAAVVRLTPPGASGPATHALPKGKTMKPIHEQIADFQARRAAAEQKMLDLTEKSAAAGATLDEHDSEEFDGAQAEVAAIDKHISRLKAAEAIAVAKGTAVTAAAGVSETGGATVRGGGVISVHRNLPKGTAFTRYALAVANSKGSLSDALKIAERWQDSTPEVGEYIKAAAMTSTTSGAPLVDPANMVGEFLELLRPATIVGRINGLRRVPFNVQIPVQTGGSLVGWVGEAAAKPVGELTFENFTLGVSKVAGIVVLSDELVRLSTPSAEATVRQDLVNQTAQFLDQQFLDPTVTATAARPASITNGVTPIAATGATADDLRADLRALRAAYYAANMDTANTVLIMSTVLADAIGDMVNPLGQAEFPGMADVGNNRTIRGMQIITSTNVPATVGGTAIVMAKASDILLADDGQTVLDASREATLDMAGGTAPAFNLWQRNCVGIRAERWIRWQKARPAAVQFITGANYGA